MWWEGLSSSIPSVPTNDSTGGPHAQRHRHPLLPGPAARDRRDERAARPGGNRSPAPLARPLPSVPSGASERWDSSVVATRVTSTRFVGRDAELSELRAALAEAAAGRPALAFVAG